MTLPFMAVGGLFMIMAIPLMARRVGPNAWYGLRTADTLRDERVWFEANARSGRELFILGLVLLVLAAFGVAPRLWLVVAVGGAIALAFRGLALARAIHGDLNDHA